MKKYTKSIPEFVYLIEEGAWFAGPFVNPQKGRQNRKFKLVEVFDEDKKENSKTKIVKLQSGKEVEVVGRV